MDSGASGEDDLIARHFAPLAGPAALGLKDDTALLRPTPGHDLVATADALVAGVHFFADDPAGSIARKALGVNLSDLAAKGARPVGFLLTLALPQGTDEDWLASFAEGLGLAASDSACPLMGGDTVSTPGPLTLSITALGEVPAGRFVPRTGAQAGDVLLVSGTIGDGALGLRQRLGREAPLPPEMAEAAHLIDRYLHPRPRLGLAEALRSQAHAAMDVSDGLVGDCAKMLHASGVGGVLDVAAVPLSSAARLAIARDTGLREVALTGGDDYEILCAAPPEAVPALQAMAAEAGIPLTVIGRVEAQVGLRCRDGEAEVTFARGSFSHF
jgi:thiamine-monophosphate kinase